MDDAIREPRGPRPFPLLGHLPQFWRDPRQFLVACAETYGDVVRLQIGAPTLLLTSPHDLQHVLVAHPERYAKTLRISGPRGQRALGESVATSLGTAHLHSRRALQPSFHLTALEAFGPRIAAAATSWVSERTDGERLNLAEHMRALALRVMALTLFGHDLSRDTTLLAAIAARRRYHESVVGTRLPSAMSGTASLLPGYRRALKTIDAALTRALHAHRQAATPHTDHMLSHWTRARRSDGAPLTDAHIRDEALTFIDTGYETIGAALTWTCYLLAQHPDVEDRLASELVGVLNGRSPTAADLRQLPYAAAVLKESLRLYPPAWNFVRTALTSDVLPSNVPVAPGTKLFLCPYIVQRNPRYFPDPQTFSPDRFLGQRDQPRFSYFPFGGGPHVCIGQPLAELECLLILSEVTQRLRFELVSREPPALDSAFALRPRHGLWARVRIKNV